MSYTNPTHKIYNYIRQYITIKGDFLNVSSIYNYKYITYSYSVPNKLICLTILGNSYVTCYFNAYVNIVCNEGRADMKQTGVLIVQGRDCGRGLRSTPSIIVSIGMCRYLDKNILHKNCLQIVNLVKYFPIHILVIQVPLAR